MERSHLGAIAGDPCHIPLYSLPLTDYAISKPGVLSQSEPGADSCLGDDQDSEEQGSLPDPTAGACRQSAGVSYSPWTAEPPQIRVRLLQVHLDQY